MSCQSFQKGSAHAAVARKLGWRKLGWRKLGAEASAVLATVAVLGACGGETAQKPGPQSALELQGVKLDDRSRCDFQGRSDRDVHESSTPSSPLPNVRRVYGLVGTGDERRRVLLCREVDTNLDGVKDVVRTYDDAGDKLSEQADSDYDGRIDTWIVFGGGKILKLELDKARTGSPDETRYYIGGKVARIQRDKNHDGKPDVFEVYEDGRLVRMGVDADYDGRVDRWDRDELRAREDAEREAREEEERRAKERGEGAPGADASEAQPEVTGGADTAEGGEASPGDATPSGAEPTSG